MADTVRCTVGVGRHHYDVEVLANIPTRDVVSGLVDFLSANVPHVDSSEDVHEFLGDKTRAFVLTPEVGQPLDGGKSLAEQDVLDGSCLQLSGESLIPAQAILVDDVSESISSIQSELFPGATAGLLRRVGACVAGIPLLVAAVLFMRLSGDVVLPAGVLGFVACLVVGFAGFVWGRDPKNDTIAGWVLSCSGFAGAGLFLAHTAIVNTPLSVLSWGVLFAGVGLVLAGGGMMLTERAAGWGVLSGALGVVVAAAVSLLVSPSTSLMGGMMVLCGLVVMMAASPLSLRLAGIVLPKVPTLGEKVDTDQVMRKALQDASTTNAQLAAMMSQEERVVEARKLLIAFSLSSIALLLVGAGFLGWQKVGVWQAIVLVMLPLILVSRGSTYADKTVTLVWMVAAGVGIVVALWAAGNASGVAQWVLLLVSVAALLVASVVALWGRPFTSPLSKWMVEIAEFLLYVSLIVSVFFASSWWDVIRGLG